MEMISVVCFLIGFASVYGTSCRNITGVWTNEQHSNITLLQYRNHFSFLELSGVYKKISNNGTLTLEKLTGIIRTVEANGSLITFTTISNEGASVTAWVGQCMVCDGQEKIFATWVEQSIMPPHEKAMSTRVSQTTFWKIESPMEEHLNQESSEREPTDTVNSDLRGHWISGSEDGFNILRLIPHGTISGFHLIPGDMPHFLYGLINGNTTYTALGLVSENLTRVKAWAGHVHNPQPDCNEIETSWLSHAFTNKCNNPREDLLVGTDTYTKGVSDGIS